MEPLDSVTEGFFHAVGVGREAQLRVPPEQGTESSVLRPARRGRGVTHDDLERIATPLEHAEATRRYLDRRQIIGSERLVALHDERPPVGVRLRPDHPNFNGCHASAPFSKREVSSILYNLYSN